MALSRTVALFALLLAAALAAGHALGEDGFPVPDTRQTIQKKLDEREAQRRAAMVDAQRKKDEFKRLCSKSLKTELELKECQMVYRSM